MEEKVGERSKVETFIHFILQKDDNYKHINPHILVLYPHLHIRKWISKPATMATGPDKESSVPFTLRISNTIKTYGIIQITMLHFLFYTHSPIYILKIGET